MAVKMVFKQSEEVRQLVEREGLELFDPPSWRKQWTASRIVRTREGFTLPLLWFLAERKFGAWDPKEWIMYWKDKDAQNESLENVERTKAKTERQTRVNPFGAPSGSPEYMKAYREQNRDKVRAYHRKRYAKSRELWRRDKESKSTIDTSPIEDEMAERLRKILEGDVPVRDTLGTNETQTGESSNESSQLQQPVLEPTSSILSTVSNVVEKAEKA